MALETAVMKIGGSIITDRDSDDPAPLKEEMYRTAAEIAPFDGDLVLVHGAGSYGHPQAAASDLDTGIDDDADRLDMARIQRLQNQLNVLYTRILQIQEVPAFPVQPSACCVMQDGALQSFDTTVVTELLRHGMVPVLFGTPALDTEQDVAILSGDVLAPAIGAEIGADMVLHATDVDGVYPEYPPDDGMDVIDELDGMQDVFGDSGKTTVTGGMEQKVRHLLEHGQDGRIFNGTNAGTIEQALEGDDVGTAVAPAEDA